MSRLPNILTVLRIVLAVFFVIFITQESLTGVVTAAVIFFLASLTDYYDGYFAKKHKVFSNFGVIRDPIADIVLILAAFFIFMQMELVPEWMFLIIFVREVVVTGSRLMAMRKGRVIAAEKAGKYKTVSQMVAVSVILLFIILEKSALSSRWTPQDFSLWHSRILVLMLVAVILTVYSGVQYFGNKRKHKHA